MLQSMGSQRVGHDSATKRQQIPPNSKVNVDHSQFSAHTVPLTHTPRPRFHPAVNSLLKCSVSGYLRAINASLPLSPFERQSGDRDGPPTGRKDSR